MARYTKKPVDPSNLGTDPNSYTYVDGYGFTPPPPVITERRMLQFYANGLGFAVLFYFLLSGFVPFLLLRLFALAWPVIRVYGDQVIASSSVILMANLLSSVICLTIPFFVFVLLCRVPLRTAFPLRRFSPGFADNKSSRLPRYDLDNSTLDEPPVLQACPAQRQIHLHRQWKSG